MQAPTFLLSSDCFIESLKAKADRPLVAGFCGTAWDASGPRAAVQKRRLQAAIDLLQRRPEVPVSASTASYSLLT